MNLIFKSSPTHPWFPGWVLEPRNCTTGFHERKHESFFQTLPELGVVTPLRKRPEWKFELFLPSDIRIHLMFNGFCGYHITRKTVALVELFTPEPGVLWGRSLHLQTPQLLTKKAVKKTEGFEWMESEEQSVLFAERDGIFCLISKTHRFEDAVRLAEKYFSENFERYLKEEYRKREKSDQLFEQFTRYDALAMLCSETMMRAIRPPEGNILTSWSRTKGDVAQLDVNELPVLAMAWIHLDPSIAQELLLGVLRLQNNAGALPVLYAPHQTFSLLEAPKPLLARIAEKIWSVTKDRDFLVEVIPLLRRHILWLLQHFDPQRRKVYSWQNKKEGFDSEQYESECASVDLLALLLSEISALNQLQDQLSIQTGEQILYFKEEREYLESMLQKEFWNKDEGRFNRAYIRDKEMVLDGFSEFFPLLFNEIPELQRTEVLNRLCHSSFLPGANEMLSWRVTSPDQTSFPLLQQLILLDILETNDSKGIAARDFTRLLLHGFMEWHTTILNKNQPIDLDPAMAAFIITLMATHHYRDRRKTVATHFLGKMQEKLNISRFDVAVVGIVIFAFLTSHFIYDHLQEKPPFKILSEEMNSAFFDRNVKKMITNAELIQHYYPEKAAKAQFLLANLALIHGDLKKAESFFLKVRDQVPDSPAPMVFLGITYQKQGKFKEANNVYDEFTFLYDEIFPTIVEQVREYQYMMEEGFKSPPGWRKLYKYKAMNELEPNE